MEFHCNCPVLLDFSLKRDPVELHYANRNLSKSPRPSAAGERSRAREGRKKREKEREGEENERKRKRVGSSRKNDQENLADPFPAIPVVR